LGAGAEPFSSAAGVTILLFCGSTAARVPAAGNSMEMVAATTAVLIRLDTRNIETLFLYEN